MMADTDEKINECIKKSLFICYRSTHRLEVRAKNVNPTFAILSTGFGEKMIFTVYALTKVLWELFYPNNRKIQNNY